MKDMVDEPEYIITTKDNDKQRKVAFSELFKLKDSITSLMYLWNFNSYYVNIEQGYFLINGGKKLQPKLIENMSEIKVEYARRNKMDILLDNNESTEDNDVTVTYLLGLKGKNDTGDISILLHISCDGSMWMWKNKR